MAWIMAGIVFSGIRPRPPRCPCISNCATGAATLIFLLLLQEIRIASSRVVMSIRIGSILEVFAFFQDTGPNLIAGRREVKPVNCVLLIKFLIRIQEGGVEVNNGDLFFFADLLQRIVHKEDMFVLV